MADAIALTDRPAEHAAHTTDRRGAVRFGLLFAAVIAGVFGVLRPLLFSRPFPVWPWIAAAVIAALVLLVAPAASLLFRAWMKFAGVMQAVNSTIILALVYALIIVPLGLVIRLFGRAIVREGIDREANTYRRPAAPPDWRKRMERPY